MEKLEIKHAVPYLPYGLKAVHEYSDRTMIGVVSRIEVNQRSDGSVWYDISLKNKERARDVSLESIKLVLRPLSDLYKEDENGLIPIIELARISFKNSVYGRFICEKDKCKVWSDSSSITFRYSPIYGFTLHYNGRIEPAKNQLDLFTYLFEHHYDVFGLIDKGLAIDLNSISHE